jgi:hypothetical protein
MKRLNIVLLAYVAIFFSCSKEPPTFEVYPENTQVSGDLAANIEVVEQPYTISYSGGDLRLAVKLKALNSLEGQEFEEIKAELLDDSGMPVSGLGTFRISKGLWAAADDNAKVDEILKNGSGETAIELIYSSWGAAGTKEALKLLEEGRTFMIFTETSKLKSSPTVVSTPATSSSTGSTNWNKLLDSYENYVDQYIKLMKKANEGDMSAMTEYIDFMEKAEDLSEKLEDADDELTTAQATRFLKIQDKMLNAAMEMVDEASF